MKKVRIASLLHDSVVDGVGLRCVIFTQGCSHHCPGCHNAHVWDPDGGVEFTTEDLLDSIAVNPLVTGVTLSGGDPMDQATALLPFVETVFDRGLSMWVYTGYLWEDLVKHPPKRELALMCDVLVDGPFIEAKKMPVRPFCGSANQRFIDIAKTVEQETLTPPVLWCP